MFTLSNIRISELLLYIVVPPCHRSEGQFVTRDETKLKLLLLLLTIYHYQ